MGPEEAARIFETMEGAPCCLDVVTRMGERRLAPILAQMSPGKAQAPHHRHGQAPHAAFPLPPPQG